MKAFGKCIFGEVITLMAPSIHGLTSGMCDYSICYNCILKSLKNKECSNAYYNLCMCPKDDMDCAWAKAGNPGALFRALGMNQIVAAAFEGLSPAGDLDVNCEGDVQCGGEGDQKKCIAKDWGKFSVMSIS